MMLILNKNDCQVAETQLDLAGNMRKHLEDENYVANSRSLATPASSIDVTAKTGQTTKKTTAAIAAEVADMLAASSSSQYIMTSVLSTFAAEQEKNAGLTTSSTVTTPVSSLPNNVAISSVLKPEGALLDPNIFMPGKQFNPSQNNLYQIPSATMQAQYHSLPNPTSQHYLQPSGGTLSSYAYGSIPPLPSGPPPIPPPPPPQPLPYMLSPMPLLTQQQVQLSQQQPLATGHQPSPLSQQQPVPLPPQPPAPSFRPVAPMQPPGFVYYAPAHHSQ